MQQPMQQPAQQPIQQPAQQPMMEQPSMEMPMNQEPMFYQPMQQPMMQEPMMEQPMEQQPMEPHMMQQPMMDMEEEQMKMMYPKIYIFIMPYIKHHCDMHEHMHGTEKCPAMEDIEDMTDKVYNKVEADLDSKFGSEDDENMRVPRYGRRGAVKDLISILLLNEFIRRRRRRRPRPYYRYGY